MKTLRVGVLINTTVKPSRDFLVCIEQCVQTQIEEHPGLVLKYFLGSAATTAENLQKFFDSGLDVVIFNGVGTTFPFSILKSLPRRPPAVFAVYEPFGDEEWEALDEGAVVLFDNSAIGTRAADFFIARGLRNFAFLSRAGYREDVTGAIRGKAFQDRIREACGDSIGFFERTIGTFADNEDYWEIDQIETGKWLETLPCPCGIFVNGDHLAFRLVQGCKRHNIPIPERFEVLGVDNNDGCCEKADPTVSSIALGIDKFAAKALEVAISVATNPKIRKSRISQTVSSSVLVERGSTAIGRGYGRIAVRAKEFIRSNACKGISVLSVAKALGVSRRTLEIRVREATGKSVHMLISEVKLDEVCRLLKDTDIPISEVITRAGYSLTTNAFVLFKKTYGMTMREYRRINRPKSKIDN